MYFVLPIGEGTYAFPPISYAPVAVNFTTRYTRTQIVIIIRGNSNSNSKQTNLINCL